MSRTKQYKTLTIIFSVLSALCVFGPLIYYFVIGWNKIEDPSKYKLSIAAITCLIIVVINTVFKFHFRSFIWILLIAILNSFADASDMLTAYAVLQIIDELIITPINNHFKNKYKINKEIDIRVESYE